MLVRGGGGGGGRGGEVLDMNNEEIKLVQKKARLRACFYFFSGSLQDRCGRTGVSFAVRVRRCGVRQVCKVGGSRGG